MPKSVRSFDRITIPAPCDADWDSMVGSDQVRFCEHCNLHVTNLSSMTRAEAMRFVARSRGRLCVRYIQTNGEILNKEVPKQLYRIGRRVSRIAAGAFSATLSLTSAAAQTQSDSRSSSLQRPQAIASLVQTANQGATVSGVVKDPNGAVIPQATVTLTNIKTQTSFLFVTQDDGAYSFSLLEPGSYNLVVEAIGFSRFEMHEVGLAPAITRTIDFDLTIPTITAEVEIKSENVSVMGMAAVREPVAPLAKAAYKDDLNAVVELIHTTPDIDAFDEFTNTNALAYAIENRNRDMVYVLLSAGASINAASKHGQTPLMYLNDGATVELVRDLISAGANLNAQDDSSETPLMRAASACAFPVIKELIDAGARIDAKDYYGNTVLMRAAGNVDQEVLKFLVAAGGNVEAKNNDGESALTIAARTGKGQNLKALIDAGGTFNLKEEQLSKILMEAVRNEDPAIVRILLDAGASAKAKDEDGSTALMLAAQYGKPETIKALIDAGAEINAVDDDGWTALMHADEVENALVLLNAGADLVVKNKDGETALATANKYDQKEIVSLLKSRGAPE